MSEEDDGKWTCHVCTYSNWSSSVKCTMCLARRSAEDIYRLQGEVQGEGGAKPPGARAVTPELPVWSCSVCTFHNSEHSARCLQCDTPRRNVRSPKNTNIAAENSKFNLKNDRYNEDSDEFEYNFRKISKSNSQNLGCSNPERASIIKSNSQNIIESAFYHSKKKNLDVRSPEKGNIRDREQNVMSGEMIDSNILAESLENTPASRNFKLQRNLAKKPLEERDNINELAKAKSNLYPHTKGE